MGKLEEAQEILAVLGLPRQQQNERSALTLLAFAGIGKRDSWSATATPLLRVWDVMAFMRERYGKDYAANSRETIRRQTIHQFEQARLLDRNPDDPTRATNSGQTVYRLTNEAAKVLRAFGTPGFSSAAASFAGKFGSLQAAYSRQRKTNSVPLLLPDGEKVFLSPGKHNVLQARVIEDFGPRFAAGAVVLYVGDTAKKHVVLEAETLSALGVPITQHDKLPDVILYDAAKGWLFLVEAVTSHGPVSPKRHAEMEKVLRDCTADRVYVTAFLTIADFRKSAGDIAWETEVWIAENPGHMIHYNGAKFLGPYGGAGSSGCSG